MLEEVPSAFENDSAEELLLDSPVAEEIDYSHFSKEEFQKLFEKTSKEGDLTEQMNVFKKIKPYIDEIYESEKNAALDRFISSGGDADDFEFKGDGFHEKFESTFSKVRTHFIQQHKDAQLKKEQNLKLKNDILAQMKAIIDSGSIGKSAFEKFKTLQEDWKKAGQVPFDKVQEMWSSYQAVVNRFYDQRSIAFELLDLDRKKNLQAKQYLIEKAEKLAAEPSIQKALKELEALHDEFKHIGPVVKELQDEVWNKFKEASNKIYERKKEYLEELKGKYQANLAVKQALLQKLDSLVEFTSDKPEAWAAQTKLLDALQEEWKKAGLIEKEKVKEINRHYWDTLKKFYNAKRAFFKDLEKFKNENLRLKTELCEKAEMLSNSIDWDKTTTEIIELQKQWKTVGHVPLKMKDKIYDRFKKACDSYFEAKRGNSKAAQEAAKAQLKERFDFIEAIEKAADSAFATAADINAKIEEWNKLAEVNGVEAQKAYNRFIEAIKGKLKAVNELSEIEKDNLVSKLIYKSLRSSQDGQKELILKEKKLRKDIRDIEDNIAQMKNNMEFFARAKNAEVIRKDFNEKIQAEEKKLLLAKSRLKVLLQN